MVPQPSPAIAGPRQQAWFRALDHARLLNVKPTDSYRVTSPRAGDTYFIHPMEDAGVLTYECSCKAGENGRICWHAALVAALPGECARRRRHNAQARSQRIVPSTDAAVAYTKRLMAETTSSLISGVAPSLAEMFA